MARRRKIPAEAVWAYFYNEVPTFGTGWRIVVPGKTAKVSGVLKISIREWASGVSKRIPYKVWKEIARKTREVDRGRRRAA